MNNPKHKLHKYIKKQVFFSPQCPSNNRKQVFLFSNNKKQVYIDFILQFFIDEIFLFKN